MGIFVRGFGRNFGDFDAGTRQ